MSGLRACLYDSIYDVLLFPRQSCDRPSFELLLQRRVVIVCSARSAASRWWARPRPSCANLRRPAAIRPPSATARAGLPSIWYTPVLVWHAAFAVPWPERVLHAMSPALIAMARAPRACCALCVPHASARGEMGANERSRRERALLGGGCERALATRTIAPRSRTALRMCIAYRTGVSYTARACESHTAPAYAIVGGTHLLYLPSLSACSPLP